MRFKPQSRNQHMVWIEPHIHTPGILKTLPREACTDQQYQGERDFSHHETGSQQTGSRTFTGISTAVFERLNLIDPRGLPRRRESKQNPRHDRKPKRHGESWIIKSEIVA